MEISNIVIQKLSTREGFLLRNTETGAVGNPVYIPSSASTSVWEEIRDPNYTLSQSGSYIDPIEFTVGMTVQTGLWYTDGADIWEAIKDGMPSEFGDKEYFEVIA